MFDSLPLTFQGFIICKSINKSIIVFLPHGKKKEG